MIGRGELERVCEANSDFFEYYDGERVVTFDPPVRSNTSTDNTRFLHGERTIRPPFVCEMTNVDLLGYKAIKARDHRYINANWTFPEFLNSAVVSLSKGTLPIQTPITPSREIELAVSLVGVSCYGYSHWLQDYLQLLEGVEHYREATGRDPTLIIPPDPPAWMIDSLHALGYTPSDYTEWTGSNTRIRTLVLPTKREFANLDAPSPFLYIGNRWAADRIRSDVVCSTDSKSGRVYLSRNDAAERRVVNEAEVMDVLGDRGFEKYELGQIPFRERVELFENAAVIVGPHGAGLAYMMFSDRPTVVELFGVKLNYNYYSMANCLDFPYGRLACDSTGTDMIVDVDELDAIVTEMLERS